MTIELKYELPLYDEADLRNMILRVIYSQNNCFVKKSIVSQVYTELLPSEVKQDGEFSLVEGYRGYVIRPNESFIEELVSIYVDDGVKAGQIKKLGFAVYQLVS